MAKLSLLLGKLFTVWIYNGAASIVLHSTFVSVLYGEDSANSGVVTALIGFFLVMVFLPEILWIIWPSFRHWIKTGIEDSDGKLNKSDMKDAGFIYVSLWCMRIFMGFSVAMMFGVEIDTLAYLASLLGSFGIAGLSIIKNIMGKK